MRPDEILKDYRHLVEFQHFAPEKAIENICDIYAADGWTKGEVQALVAKAESANNVVEIRQAPKVEANMEVYPHAKTSPKEYSDTQLEKMGARQDVALKIWLINRCSGCGNFGKDKCCGTIQEVCMVRPDGTLTTYGRQAAGLDPIRKPAPPVSPLTTKTEVLKQEWMLSFSGLDEMEDGGIKMYIENFLPEGITAIAGLPKEGKTWLALSVCKALTNGQPLFGKAGFEVPEAVPVLYLAAEVGDRPFKQRLRKFGITNDKTKFLCRTLTKGSMGLRHPDLEAAVRTLKPVIILDVLACFSESNDEDDSVENQKLRGLLGNLRRAGARAIIVVHHSIKAFRKNPTKENALRGTGDILGMLDCLWKVLRDEPLYVSSHGVEEIDVMSDARDCSVPSSIRLAITRKAAPSDLITRKKGIVSVIDTTGDLGWVDVDAAKEAAEVADQAKADTLERMVQDNPTITLTELAKQTGGTVWAVNATLKDKGWSKPSGRAKKGRPHQWMKTNQQVAVS